MGATGYLLKRENIGKETMFKMESVPSLLAARHSLRPKYTFCTTN